MLGIISMVLFNLADTYFIGQYGKDELTALSFTFPVIMVIFSLVQGIAVGATALISRSIGADNKDKAKRETTDSLILGVILAGFFVAVGLLTIKPVFRLLGAEEDIIPLVSEYMQIWYLAIMFVVVPFIGNSAIRSTGDARTPALIMLFAVGINILLDPLLIFGYGPFPELGLKGAAIATATSRGLTLVLSLAVLFFRLKLITFHNPGWKVLKECWGAILYIGLPAGFSRMMIPVAMGIITAMIARHGQEAVAAFGVGSRIEFLSMSVLIAVSASIGPFVGQNNGAAKYGRIKLAIKNASGFSVLWGLFACLMLYLFRDAMANAFTDSEGIIQYVTLYLTIVPISYGFQGVTQIISANLSTLNKPLRASGVLLLQMFILMVPLAWIGSEVAGVSGIFVGVAIAYILGGILSYIANNFWLQPLYRLPN